MTYAVLGDGGTGVAVAGTAVACAARVAVGGAAVGAALVGDAAAFVAVGGWVALPAGGVELPASVVGLFCGFAAFVAAPAGCVANTVRVTAGC